MVSRTHSQLATSEEKHRGVDAHKGGPYATPAFDSSFEGLGWRLNMLNLLAPKVEQESKQKQQNRSVYREEFSYEASWL